MKITNKNYREFLNSGLINLIDESHIKEALDNIKGKYVKEGRALLIMLYYTGARPVEVLKLKAKDIRKESSYLVVDVPGAKGGKYRSIYLQLCRPMVKELYSYCIGLFESMYLFYNYRSDLVRFRMNKKGNISPYTDISNKLHYHIKKWFRGVVPDSIPPYFLRHNKFSTMAKRGASRDDIKYIKGAKSLDSVEHYVHLSTKTARKLARINY